MEMDINLDRREALKIIAASTCLCVTGIQTELVESAFAMGKADIPQGVQKVEGDVTINGIPAKAGDQVSSGDVIVTGKNSLVIFVFEDSACMMKENSRMTVKNSDKTAESGKLINALRLMDGKLLSVFGSGSKTVETPTAYIGIRGTGIYIEVDHEKTYICTCYGKVLISLAADKAKQEAITAKHHEAPRYVYGTNIIKQAPMLNHTDAELTMLEALVGRIPPFGANSGKKEGGGGY